jgi:AhpD family alkylhydroperoxidase
MRAMQDYVNATGLEHSLLELVKLRASYMNGCGYCADMHTKDARAAGETEQRLYLLPLWREAPFYTDRERAALAWTEAVTDVEISDAVYHEALAHFTEQELVELTMAVVAINGWNRLSVAFQTEVGSYKPRVS